MTWTVSAFVKRDGRWERIVRVVDDLPTWCDAPAFGSPSRATADKLRAWTHEILGVQGEDVRGESVTAGSGLPPWASGGA